MGYEQKIDAIQPQPMQDRQRAQATQSMYDTVPVLKKFDQEQLEAIVAELELPEAVLNKIAPMQNDMRILTTLIESQQLQAAIQFLALGLPKREAIWWAYICLVTREADSQDVKTQNALRIISGWVRTPHEDYRRSAKSVADSLSLYTPASWVAMAIFWSGGSIAPEDRVAVEPKPFMCGHAVTNAVVMAANQTAEPNHALKNYIKRGLHIAVGGNGRIG